MLRRHALASALYVFGGGALAASTRPGEVFEAFFRQFGEPGRAYVALDTVLDASASPGASKALLREFPVRTRKHRARDFGSVSIRLLTNAEYVEIFTDSRGCSAGWSEFHARFPNARVLLQLSEVRFVKDGSEAHFLAQVSSACLGGTMDKFRFVREGATWRFVDSENLGRA
jgi:hypothetical protein